MNYAYIVECCDGTYYCGYTNNLDKRMEAHNSGKGAKYTRPRRPVKLMYYEEFEDKNAAMSREWHLKKLTHEQKKKLIQVGSFLIID